MRFFVALLLCGLVCPCSSFGGPKSTYSNLWLLKTNSDGDTVKQTSSQNGFKTVAEPFPGYYVLEEENTPVSMLKSAPMSSKLSTLTTVLRASELNQLMYLNHSTRAAVKSDEFNITDSQWSDMWHVESSQFPSMGIYDAWVDGYTGIGIHVAIVDNGIEPTHIDLVENYDESISFDYLTNSSFVNQTESESHGTLCAGLVAAVKNDECVIGTAYQSTISAVKIFNNYFGLTDYGESLALINQLDSTHVYSNSWGPWDTGDIIEGPGELAQEALRIGATQGRNGKGAIYTWAAGNGGIYDDCNCDGYANSIYTISVTSVGTDQAPSYYSEECSSVMVGTYSGDSPDLTIVTTWTNDRCTTGFQGTSASCPIGAGIIALVLEANPDLTWRDVQYLLVHTSETDGLILADWQVNGAGFRVSHSFGFGLMNAANMIERAKIWTNVPEQVVCTSPIIDVDETSDNGVYIISELNSDGCSANISSLEHVQVWVSVNTTYRGRIVISLFSPQRTRSRLLRERRYDRFSGEFDWTFMTVFSWGENPNGNWILQLETVDSSVEYTLQSWSMTMYGTRVQISDTGAQVSQEPVDQSDSNNAGAIAGGVVGGVAFFALIAAGAYIVFVKMKPKDPTIYPTNADMPANTSWSEKNDGYTRESSGYQTTSEVPKDEMIDGQKPESNDGINDSHSISDIQRDFGSGQVNEGYMA